MSDRGADGISVAWRPPPSADAKSVACTDAGTNCGSDARSGTTRYRDLAGTVLHAGSADSVSDAGPIDRAKRCRFSGAAAFGGFDTDAATITVTSRPSVDNAVTDSNSFGKARSYSTVIGLLLAALSGGSVAYVSVRDESFGFTRNLQNITATDITRGGDPRVSKLLRALRQPPRPSSFDKLRMTSHFANGEMLRSG